MPSPQSISPSRSTRSPRVIPKDVELINKILETTNEKNELEKNIKNYNESKKDIDQKVQQLGGVEKIKQYIEKYKILKKSEEEKKLKYETELRHLEYDRMLYVPPKRSRSDPLTQEEQETVSEIKRKIAGNQIKLKEQTEILIKMAKEFWPYSIALANYESSLKYIPLAEKLMDTNLKLEKLEKELEDLLQLNKKEVLEKELNIKQEELYNLTSGVRQKEEELDHLKRGMRQKEEELSILNINLTKYQSQIDSLNQQIRQFGFRPKNKNTKNKKSSKNKKSLKNKKKSSKKNKSLKKK